MENKIYSEEINPTELVEVLKKIENKLQSQRNDINQIFNLLQDTRKIISEKSTQATKDEVKNGEVNGENILIIVEKKYKELIQKYTKNNMFFENIDYKAVSNEFFEFILNEIKRNFKTTNIEIVSQNDTNETQETQNQEQNKIVIDEAIDEKQELLDKLQAKNQELEDKNKRIAELEDQLKRESKVRNRIIEPKKEIESEKEKMPDKKREWFESKERQERILDKNNRSKVEILNIEGNSDGK